MKAITTASAMKFALKLFALTLATLLSAALGFKLGYSDGGEDADYYKFRLDYESAMSHLQVTEALDAPELIRTQRLSYMQTEFLPGILVSMENSEEFKAHPGPSVISCYKEYLTKRNLSLRPQKKPSRPAPSACP